MLSSQLTTLAYCKESFKAGQHHNRPFSWPTETDTVRAKHNKWTLLYAK